MLELRESHDASSQPDLSLLPHIILEYFIVNAAQELEFSMGLILKP